MSIELSFADEGLSADELQACAREMRDELFAEAGIEAEFVTTTAPAGAKGGGEWETAILLLKSLGVGLGGGGGVALFNVMKTYLQRKPTLEIEVKRKGGEMIKVKADDLSKAERREVLQKLLAGDGKQA